MSQEVPDLLNSLKSSADTPDAEFTGAITPFTAVDGASGTALLLNSSGTGLYDVASRPGWVLMQVGTAATNGVEFKQDYTLPDGKCIVAALSVAHDAAVASNEVFVGIAVNQDDTGVYAGTDTTTAGIHIDSEANAAPNRMVGWDGANLIGTATGIFPARDLTFVRIDRVALVYHLFWSQDGFAWSYIGGKTLASAATNVWLFAQCNATMGNRVVVGCAWFRQGTALAVDPFPL